MLGPMHTILSGVKALWCSTAYEGIKIIRECCGAAGFSQYSALPGLIDTISSYVTLEGDSAVMYLQTARSLLKNGSKVISSQGKSVNKMIEYIGDLTLLLKGPIKSQASSQEFFKDEMNLLEILKFNALIRIGKCLQLFADPKYKDFSMWEKFNERFQIDLIKMA